jgi:hypothetical protein
MTHLQSHTENRVPQSFCGEADSITEKLKECDCIKCLQLALHEHEKIHPYFGFEG